MNKFPLLPAMLFFSMLTFGQTKNFIDQPYLETTAMVDTLVKPDIIYLDILLRESDNRNRESVEELEIKMAAKLESLGIDLKEQLSLSDLGSNFKKYFLKQKDVLKSKAYKLKVFDAQTAGRVLVGLEDIGISNVSLDKTEYSKMEELKLSLKSRAVAKAKTQAEYLLKPLDQKITRALFITDKYYQSFGYEGGELNEMIVVGYGTMMKQEIKQIDIEFKPIRVETEVSIKFGIE